MNATRPPAADGTAALAAWLPARRMERTDVMSQSLRG